MKTFAISKAQLYASSAELADKANLDLGFMLLVGCAAAIATLGFGMNSPAVIIGSMIVSPLLYVVIGIAAAAFRRNWASIRSGVYSLIAGILVAVAVASVVAAISPVNEQSEIAQRLHTGAVYYFFVALFSGFAGVVAFYWPGTQEALSGLAIAVALVPPLAMTGLGIASLNADFALKSAAIVTVNTAAILLGGLLALALLHTIAEGSSKQEAV